MRKLLLLLMIVLLPTLLEAQSTSVTLQVTDAGAQSWNNGAWSVTLVSKPGASPFGPPFNFSTGGIVPNQSQNGALSATGGASLTLTPNASIVPAQSVWSFSVCPQQGIPFQCFVQAVTIAGASQTVTLTPSAISVNCGSGVNAYADSEVGCQIGGQYYNVTTPSQRQCTASTGTVCTVWVNSGSGSALPSGGTVGQALINTAPGSGTWQDPLISTNNMTLLSAVGATVTQTGTAVRIPIQSASGMLVVSGSGITGSPVGCTIVLELQQNAGAPASAAIATQAFTPNNTYQSFYISPSANFYAGDSMIAVYNCVTTFPTAGTLTVTFNPVAQASLSSRGAISNGIWVDTTDVIWSQLTNLFRTGIATPSFECCSVTSWDTTITFRILQPNGVIYDSSANGTSWTYTETISGGLGSNGGCGTGEFSPVAGWLQSIYVFISATSGGVVQQGQAFENLYVLKSMPTGGNTASCSATFASTNGPMLLTGGPLTTFYPMTWTTGQQVGGITAQMPGAKTHFVGANPAAGANYTFVISGNENNAVQSVHFVLATSSQSGNRTVCLFLNNANVNAGNTIIGYYCASGIQPPSTTIQYDAMPCVAGSGGNTFQQIIALPCGFTLEGVIGEQLTIQIQSIQTSDQISNPSINALSYQIRN